MHVRALFCLVALVAGWLLTSTSHGNESIIPSQWKSEHYRDHPLVGKLFSGVGLTELEQPLISRLALTSFILIGEIHTNADHHTIQANIVRASSANGIKRSLVWEMVPTSLSGILRAANSAKPSDLERLGDDLKWKKRGWGDWSAYQPIARAGILAGMPMKAGNLDRKTTQAISKKGLAALDKKRQAALGILMPFSNQQNSELEAELEQSHCGLLSKKSIPSMALVQRARDGSMATAMRQSADANLGGAVLIAGNGHVRRDRGVPFHLRREMPGSKGILVGKYRPDDSTEELDIRFQVSQSSAISIGLLEVENGANEPQDYGVSNSAGEPLYDYVIFTPRSRIDDPCEAMRKMFKKPQKKPEVSGD